MDADALCKMLDDLRSSKEPTEQRLCEALLLLEEVHKALDAREGQVQDLREHIHESRLSPWEENVLRALKMDAYEIGDSMSAAKDHAAQKYGYTSPEYATIEALASALDPYGKD